MPETIQIDTVHPVRLDPLEGYPQTVKNIGGKTVFYKQGALGSSVSPTNKDGEIAVGKSFQVTQPTWVIGKDVGLLEVKPEPTTVRTWARAREPDEFYVTQVPFNVKGDGETDDTAALQEAVNAGKETRVIIPPTAGVVVSSGIKIPASTVLAGLNRRTCSILAKGSSKAAGEFSVLEPVAGDIKIESLFLRCAEAQASKGAAIDLEKGFITNLTVNDCQIGSNWFNGFNCVGEGEISNIFIKDILFEEFTGGVKSIGNAGFVFGSKTNAKRVISPVLINIKGHANKQGDMPAWLRIQNTDSMFLSDSGFQNGLLGCVIGNGDTSTQGTTNFFAGNTWFDGGPEGMGKGWELNNCFAFDIWGCHAQGCSPGVYVLGNVNGSFTGGKYYHNNGSGFIITGSAKPATALAITGALICDNHEAKGPELSEGCGIFIEEKGSGLTIVGNTLGNPENMGGGEQEYGIVLGKKSENILISGNRFHKNKKALFKKEGEEVNINGKNAPTEAELETNNLKS